MYEKPITLPTHVDWLEKYQEFTVQASHTLNKILSSFGKARQALIDQFSFDQKQFSEDCEKDIRNLVRAICEQEKATGQTNMCVGHPIVLSDVHTLKDVVTLEETLEFPNGVRVSAIGAEADDRMPVVFLEEETEGEPTEFTVKSFHLKSEFPYPADIAFIYEALWDTAEQFHIIKQNS